MHFWINKQSSQGCGLNGRHRIPPSLSGYRSTKLMVTPVHRFQSIESVATSGIRHPRAPGYHTRFPVQYHPPVHYNTSHNTHNGSVPLSDTTPRRLHNTLTPRQYNSPTSRLKCGVWAFFAIVTFFIAGAKYYFHGINMGIEALAFCSLLVVVLIVGGLVSLYEALSSSWPPPAPSSSTQQEASEDLNVPNNNPSPVQTSSELPPPPYHIAIMLPSQREQHTAQIISDSPPPPYDKAVI